MPEITRTIQQLADLVQGQAEGDAQRRVTGAAPLSTACEERITFLDNPRRVADLENCRATAVVIPEDLAIPEAVADSISWIRTKDPFTAFVQIASELSGLKELPVHGIDPTASVHPTAKLGADCSVHPNAVIGEGCEIGDRCRIHPGAVLGRNCRVGNDVTLHAHVVIYDGTMLGDRVTVHANSVVGADGFGYRMINGRHVKIPQLGNVIVGDDVEIGACATIDRGTFGPTTIGEGTRIDNLVQIAHNCEIGEHNIIVAQVGIAGSCSTGQYVVLAGQVGVADHIHIGDGAMVGGQAGVVNDLEPGGKYWGTPCIPEKEQKRACIQMRKLSEMRKDLKEIKRRKGA